MSTLRQAAQQALEALEWSQPHADARITYREAITALIEALAEPPQEPICPECTAKVLYECVACSRSNYPPQRKPLTEGEIEQAYRHIYRNVPDDFDHTIIGWIEQGIRYAERAHGIKGEA